MQAIGDGGQGWGNAILYVFLSPTIREKLCNALCGNCMNALEGRLGVLLDSETAASQGNGRNQPAENGTRKIGAIAKGAISPSDVTPLIQATPATGYGVKEYMYDTTTTTGTQLENSDILNSTAT